MPGNIVLVTADSVRPDHTGILDYGRDTTPRLDSLDSTDFENAYANAPYTPGSVPSLLTSRYPLEDGHIVFREFETVAEHLEGSEYTTGAFFNNIQIPRFGYHEHFDEFEDLSQFDAGNQSTIRGTNGPIEMLQTAVWNGIKDYKRLGSFVRDQYLRFNEIPDPHPPDKAVTDSVLEFIEGVTPPFFVWIHFMDTHHPYNFDTEDFEEFAEKSYDPHQYGRLLARAKTHVQSGEYVWTLNEEQRKTLTAAYDASIRSVDRQVGRLLDILEDDDWFIFTSDHGEELWDRGHFGHAARPSKPRTMTLYDEMIHVPLSMTGPSVETESVGDFVSLVDILPTVLDIAGEPIPDSIRGTSLLDVIVGSNARPIITHATTPGDPNAYVDNSESSWIGAIRWDGFKLVAYEERPNELYEITSDLDERHDVIAENRNRAEDLRERLSATIGDTESGIDQERTEAEVTETLKQLGYLE